jgi:hypothetical protein
MRGVAMSDPYYSDYSHVSNSMLNVLMDSPKKYHRQFVVRTMVQEETKALRFGRLVHCLALEPETFDSQFAVEQKFDRRTNAGKAAYAEFVESNQGKTIITDKERKLAVNCVTELMAQDEIGELLLHSAAHQAKVELPLRFDLFGMPAKCKIDWFSESLRVIVDVKTTDSVVPENFDKAVFGYGYHRQNAIYAHAVEQHFGFRPRFLIAAVSKKEPHDTALRELSAADVSLGMSEVETLITDLKNRTAANNWKPSYSSGIVPVERPRWYRGQVLTMDEETDEFIG